MIRPMRDLGIGSVPAPGETVPLAPDSHGSLRPTPV